MATIHIDGNAYQVKDGQNLLEACIALGLNVPYFCWHPALGSVGACRQCAVKQFANENDKNGRIVMSCMTPATEGVRITVDDPDSKQFRGSVIEWMMTNHPHDCPVCDEGGECHLQDMTLMTGHNYRDYRFDKKTYVNQYLGPLINHEMNRCIQCYRCVRYYKDYAGGRDLDAFAAHNNVYFGREQDGVLESEFSGNLVEVCPTGVFTDKSLKKHYTRRWDLTTAPSVCVHCALGCNTTPGERYGKLRRIRNRYNRGVNGYFLCDRGRYGYEFVNAPSRPKAPLKKTGTQHSSAFTAQTREGMLEELGALWKSGAKAIGIGSPRASIEANFSLRTLVGAEHFYLGLNETDAHLLSTQLESMLGGPVRCPSLGELSEHDAVFILGEDLTNVAPLAALNVRQAVRNSPYRIAEKMGIPKWNDLAIRTAVDVALGPLFIATPAGGKLDDVATATWRGAPDALARLGYAIAHLIEDSAPAVDGLDGEALAMAELIAGTLAEAKHPLIIAGPSCRSVEIIKAAANIAWALYRKGNKETSLYYTAQECNSVGLGLIGGANLTGAREALLTGAADTLVILENDLYRRADEAFIDELLGAAKNLIVVDHTMNATSEQAHYLLPAATFAEGDGTLVNNIGRAQRFIQVFKPEGEITESWRWLRRIRTAAGLGASHEWSNLDAFHRALVSEVPAFSRIIDVAPAASMRVGGQKIPRQSHRFSGRTAIRANVNVSETGVAEDPDSPMAFSMEGFQMLTPAKLMSSFWMPGWNSAQAITRFQEEVNGPLEGGDPGIRLIEPFDVDIEFYEPPVAAATDAGARIAVPMYHIFGSEELSGNSAPIAELAPKPYAALHPDDVALLGAAEGDEIALGIHDDILTLPLRIDSTLAPGVIGIAAGLADMPFLDLPAPVYVTKEAAV